MKIQKFIFSPPGRILLIALGLSLYYAVFIYPFNSLFTKMNYPVVSKIFDTHFSPLDFIFIFLFLMPMIGRLSYQLFHGIWSRHFMSICMTWAGFGFFIFFPVLIFDFTHSIVNFSQQQLFWISLGLLFVASIIALLGIVNANLIFVKRFEIQDARITQETTAIQLSDVHIGSRSKIFIRKIVNKVNRLKADKVFITGDLVDLSAITEKDLSVLKKIEAPVYFVTGNHDRYVSLERLLPLLKKQNFIILRNETIQLKEFDLTGIDDAENPRQVEKVIENMPINSNRFNVLLYHRPQGFDAAAKKGINLMLSGHTHNGQIIPFGFLVKQIFKDVKGSIKRNGAHLHVSTGTSTWGPIMRIGSTNEITFISFKP
jgi:predicted MPP superfamily phosphohydrolase